MKNFILTLAAIVALISQLANPCNAQCKDFTENEAMPLLGDYIISGKYNSIKLTEGEDILIFKTLSKGIEYKFVVKGEVCFKNGVEFSVETWEGDVIYSSSNEPVWNFKCNKTQRVKIYVKVPLINSTNPENGCVTILTGIKAS
ncbi:MAG: hypothetical protein MJZ61_01570 [Bacteroidales bacterium]|nr:hypothetical protein [Bacteroidales bacterium]